MKIEQKLVMYEAGRDIGMDTAIKRLVAMDLCHPPTFAMLGALAWQVKKPNKILVFWFSGEFARALSPGFYPLLCVLSCFSFLHVFFLSVRLNSNICNSTSRLRNRAEESYDVEISGYIMATSL